MGAWLTIPIGTKSYLPRSGTQSVERLVNLYAEASEEGGKKPSALYGLPGLASWSTVGNGPIRGLHSALGYVWVVSGGTVYAVNETTKVATTIGAVNGTGPVRMIDNGTHVVIIAQPQSYAVNLTAYVVLPETNLIDAAYQDGYGIYVQRDTQNVWASAIDDLTDIPGLNITTADAKPDKVMACKSTQREVWVLKEKTTEVYANAGLPNFPFARAAFIERGCISTGSVALLPDGSLMWLDHEKRVCRSSGYQALPVSTPSIDRLIGAAYSPSSAEAFAYTQSGHVFYVLTFSDLTLVYNATTGKWMERRSYNLERWRAQGSAVVRGAILVGDYSTGGVYTLDLDTYAENSEILERILVCPPLSAEPDPILVHALELDFEAGVGLTSGQGSDPTVMLSWSDDDGRTWSSDVEASLGALGNYRWRAQFNRLGRSRNRSFRFRITDPVKVAILGARARLEAGRP